MRRLLLALRAFWWVLVRKELADRVAELISPKEEGRPGPGPQPTPEPPPAEPAPARREVPKAGRSEALTLLATLQREARFVDFIMEPLDQYSDAQIGAAVRDIHRDCAKVLDRIFGLRPIVAESEGSSVELKAGYDAHRYRVLGEPASGEGVRVRVIHRGWEATRCDLPTWTGTSAAALVIAPAELQVEGASAPRLGEGFALPPSPNES